MKKRTRVQIQRNLASLAENTICNALFLSKLETTAKFSKEELQNLEAIDEQKGVIATARCFYEMIINKDMCEGTLRTILDDTCQSGALAKLKSFNSNILFDVQSPVKSFVGRTEELDSLTKLFDIKPTNDNSITVISQTSSVIGIGGIGKTELCRKFVSLYLKQKPNINVIWLNADNEGTLNTSFKKLARELYIEVLTNEREERDINAIVQEVFLELNETECIFVYDNCDNPELFQQERYLPKYMGRHSLSRILITSRYRRWPHVNVISVDRLKLDDAISLVLNQLVAAGIPLETKDSCKTLVEQLQCFPLAIQQAVAYIIIENHSSSLYTIENYLSEYKAKCQELLDFGRFRALDCTYSQTTYTTWRVTIDKLKRSKKLDDDGILALGILSYLDPETIGYSLFQNFRVSMDKVRETFARYVAYSLLTYHRETDTISIHRLLQQVVRLEHKAATNATSIIRVALQLVKENEKSRTPLHATAVWRHASHNVDVVKEFYDTAIYSEKKFTPLHLLALEGDVDAITSIVQFFRSSNSSKLAIDQTDGFNRTTLFIAASLGHNRILEVLISASASTNITSTICFSSFDEMKLNVYDPTHWNALHIAAYYGHVEVIKVLISENSPLVNEHDSRAQTPPVIAAIVGNIESVSIMKGNDPLFITCAVMTDVIKGRSEISKLNHELEKLDKPKAILNRRLVTQDKWVGFDLTLVRIAAQVKGDKEIFELLEKYGANLFRYNGDYRELLHFSGTTNNKSLAEYVLSKVENPYLEIVNNSWTILHNACKHGGLSVIKIFNDNFCINFNVKDRQGDTPLYQAAYQGHLETVKYLVAQGADVNVVNKLGVTAVIAAAVNYKLDVVRYLIDLQDCKLFPWATKAEKETILGGMEIGLLHVLVAYDETELLEHVLQTLKEKEKSRLIRYSGDAGGPVVSLMHSAAIFNSKKCIEYLIENYPTAAVAKLNIVDCLSAFYVAAKNHDFDINYLQVVEKLLTMATVAKLLRPDLFCVTPALLAELLETEIHPQLQGSLSNQDSHSLRTILGKNSELVSGFIEMFKHFREYLEVQKNPQLPAGNELTALVRLFRREN